MCKRSGESVNHLLMHCSIARKLMAYGSDFIWSFLGDATGCGRPSRLLEW
jgi:hypothetical protein